LPHASNNLLVSVHFLSAIRCFPSNLTT